MADDGKVVVDGVISDYGSNTAQTALHVAAEIGLKTHGFTKTASFKQCGKFNLVEFIPQTIHHDHHITNAWDACGTLLVLLSGEKADQTAKLLTSLTTGCDGNYARVIHEKTIWEETKPRGPLRGFILYKMTDESKAGFVKWLKRNHVESLHVAGEEIQKLSQLFKFRQWLFDALKH